MPDSKQNPLDLVKGGPADMMIAEFPAQVGAMRFSEPAPLSPGYQGGLFKGETPPEPKQDEKEEE